MMTTLCKYLIPALLLTSTAFCEALDPNPDMGSAVVSGGRTVMRAVGQAGRRAFGETAFRGLAQNRRLADLSHNQIVRAFEDTP